MGVHLIDGDFQSDKYPGCPRGKVPLSTKDPAAQDLLWKYAQRRRAGSHGSKEVDAEFADDVETALRLKGYAPPKTDSEALEDDIAGALYTHPDDPQVKRVLATLAGYRQRQGPSLHDWVQVSDDPEWGRTAGDHEWKYRGRVGQVVIMRTGCLSSLDQVVPLVTVKFDAFETQEFQMTAVRLVDAPARPQ